MKRPFDLLVAFLVLIASAPILLGTMVTALLVMGRPVFFLQTRVGLNRRRFRMIKFRTMTVATDMGDVPETVSLEEVREARRRYKTTGSADSRVTPLGRILRKTNLDELPQLINVLRGEMSLVGPRPDVPAQRADYEPATWVARHSVKPGITGWAQVNGRSALTDEERNSYDLEYARNPSLLLDLKILLMTARQVVVPTNAN